MIRDIKRLHHVTATPGGVLFEIATNEPGFNRDEDTAHLGEALKLPSQYEQFRDEIEAGLAPLEA